MAETARGFVAVVTGLVLVLGGCKARPTTQELQAVVAQQIAIAHASYQQSLTSARALDAAIASFVAEPDDTSLEATRQAWRMAKYDYSLTETFRFGHGVVDALEGRINAWPIDEGLLDYVVPGTPAAADNPAATANFVGSDYLKFAGIEADLRSISIGTLRYLNELLGIESNVTRGFHPIEFMLWGQDLRTDGPGERPWTDYAQNQHCTDGPNRAVAHHCQKRAELLRAAGQLLVQDLVDLDAEFNPDQGSYARLLLAGDARDALRRMLFGMAALARDELAGQRIEAGLLSGGQEDEQDCFSDFTAHSHAGNALGIARLYYGQRFDALASAEAQPNSLAELLKRHAPELDHQLRAAFARTDAALSTIATRAEHDLPYDQMLRPEHPQGQALLRTAVQALQEEGRLLSAVGETLALGPLNPAARKPAVLPADAPQKTASFEGEAFPGGATTVQPRTVTAVLSRDAYSQPAPNLSLEARARFFVGNTFFTAPWVSAPASTSARDGLGPLYNAAACQNCHIKDGRGHPPETTGAAPVSFLVKIGRAPRNAEEAALAAKLGAVPDPIYGHQLQDRATAGVQAEGKVSLQWQSLPHRYPDGSVLALRMPRYSLTELAYGPLAAGQGQSARVAQPMTGLGLLEAIPEADILSLQDPDDANHDGISGRANRVWDLAAKAERLGRFGWKASQPSVRQQAALAASNDMGLSSVLFPASDCTASEPDCLQKGQRAPEELQAVVLDAITFYAQHLAVPARQWIDPPEVRAGEAAFAEVGCATCHHPAFRTGPAESPALAHQAIRPYTDLLLHDMGPALADGVPEFAALGSEWRTPPLWGLHLVPIVNPYAGFLHDGRARTLEEAILWHGGEALASRQRFEQMDRTAREQLIWFLKSL